MNKTATKPTQAELFGTTDAETRTIPFTQLPAVVEEVKESGRTIVAMQWERSAYTVTIRKP